MQDTKSTAEEEFSGRHLRLLQDLQNKRFLEVAKPAYRQVGHLLKQI